MARGAYQQGGATGVAIGAYASTLLSSIGTSALRYGYQAIAAAGTWGGVPTPYLPDEGWVDTAKIIVADVLSSVGSTDYEQGVFDRPIPQVPSVLPGPMGGWGVEILSEGTVPDFGGIYGPKTETEDWDAVYAAYCRLNPEDCDMAHDWMHTASQVLDVFSGTVGGVPPMAAPINMQTGIGAPPSAMVGPATGGAMANGAACGTGCNSPRYLTYDCRTGQFTQKRRRRRRRLLTSQDIGDLTSLVAIAGKGAALQAAVAKAVRG